MPRDLTRFYPTARKGYHFSYFPSGTKPILSLLPENGEPQFIESEWYFMLFAKNYDASLWDLLTAVMKENNIILILPVLSRDTSNCLTLEALSLKEMESLEKTIWLSCLSHLSDELSLDGQIEIVNYFFQHPFYQTLTSMILAIGARRDKLLREEVYDKELLLAVLYRAIIKDMQSCFGSIRLASQEDIVSVNDKIKLLIKRNIDPLAKTNKDIFANTPNIFNQIFTLSNVLFKFTPPSNLPATVPKEEELVPFTDPPPVKKISRSEGILELFSELVKDTPPQISKTFHFQPK